MKKMRPTKVCSTTLVYLNIFEKTLIVGGVVGGTLQGSRDEG